MVICDENWINYGNVKRKRWLIPVSWWQTVAKPGLTVRKVCCVLVGWQESSTMTGPSEGSNRPEVASFGQ
ncbi:Histone-lysine N-methyltransferase SETMAR [Caligus rogercresseyi]|uniref:Histone-lysine N-methyltransferase SETMAR n=1 Tax=Caligus rogercresseyi TaxID=217165 RepID=A0A7T8KFV4_CALRO|nr:Histone-lysine N-methyltransferase SETMAR [Caligus rogercresseyi]